MKSHNLYVNPSNQVGGKDLMKLFFNLEGGLTAWVDPPVSRY